MNRFLLLTTLAPAVLLAAAQGGPAGPDLKTRANAAVHVLRAEQKDDGSYGGSVETTSLALLGFAKCVRQYREADGPFVTRAVEFVRKSKRADGSFASAGDQDAVAATLAAALALDALDAPKYAADVKGAVAFVAKASGTAAPENPTGPALEEFAQRTAPKLLARMPADPKEAAAVLDEGRDPRGGYGSPARTASMLVLIARIAAATPPPKPEVRPAVALPAYDPNAKTDIAAVMQKAIKFLLSRQMSEGGFGSSITRGQNLGVTALVASAIWSWPGEMPAEVKSAAERATKIVADAARPDGSIHGQGLENYTTSASVGALVRSKNPQFKTIVEKARAYLIALQADEAKGITKDHWSYGGFGYGDEERPDLSNTQMAMEALHLAGTAPEDPALRRALVFLERCQNRSESNHIEISRDGVTAVAGNDGGGVYFPGDSAAGAEKSADGKKEIPRSYGSMTYALLKGFVFSGVAKDDPRLKDALAWCQRNFTLDRVPGYEEAAKVNPRAPFQGLFYYYLALATALRAYGIDTIETPDGKKHAWRSELAARLASMQKADGSFVNENSQRWFEGDEVLATAYAVLTLAELR